MSDKHQDPSSFAEISQGPGALEQFLERNQKAVAVLLVLAILGVIGWIIYGSIRNHEEETAGAALVKADDLASLQKIAAEQAGTKAAGSAALLIASEQWKAGQQPAAIATLRDFLSSQPGHPAAGAAKASLASKLMLQGKNDEAAREFQNLADDPNSYLAAYGLLSQGDMALAANDADKAENLYKKALADFPESPFAQTASQRIANLRAKAPVEIDPPPSPEKKSDEKSPSLLPDGPVTLPNGLQIEEVKETEEPASGEVSPSQTPGQP